MRKPLTIYLIGAMSNMTFDEMNKWRVEITKSLYSCAIKTGTKIEVINPVDYYNFEEVRHQNEREIMQFDLNMVKKSDLVIVNLHNLNKSIGSAIEVYESFKADKPIIAFNQNGVVDYDTIHPWLQCCITRVESNIDDLADYIRDFYMR